MLYHGIADFEHDHILLYYGISTNLSQMLQSHEHTTPTQKPTSMHIEGGNIGLVLSEQ